MKLLVNHALSKSQKIRFSDNWWAINSQTDHYPFPIYYVYAFNSFCIADVKLNRKTANIYFFKLPQGTAPRHYHMLSMMLGPTCVTQENKWNGKLLTLVTQWQHLLSCRFSELPSSWHKLHYCIEMHVYVGLTPNPCAVCEKPAQSNSTQSYPFSCLGNNKKTTRFQIRSQPYTSSHM
jgi:hypothetical protein